MNHICQLCHTDVTDPKSFLDADSRGKIVDGAVRAGGRICWASVCVPCFRNYGNGYGKGKGQLYDVATEKKLEG
jgi:hypothetical protein